MRHVQRLRYDEESATLTIDVAQFKVEKVLTITENILIELSENDEIISIKLLNEPEYKIRHWFDNGLKLATFQRLVRKQ